MSDQALDYSRRLLLETIKYPSKEAQITELKGEDAQCIADLLSGLLHEDGAFESQDGSRLFRLLKTLVKSSGVLPRCYKLNGIKCDLGTARGGGSFADIYEGEYEERKVCVKAVRVFEMGDNTKVLKAIAKEIILWAQLSHANILPFYGIYLPQRSERICIISPWMSKGDLSVYLERCLQLNTPLSRWPLVLDIVAGLRYLHGLQIVHGDLKAKNILICDNGYALLADFGISYLAASMNPASTQLSNGTVPWMAPELFDDDKECWPTLQSDMWSFGCVCYEVFTAKAPFYGAKIGQIYSALRERKRLPGEMSWLENASVPERDLANKCWSYEPDSRPSCQEMYEFVACMVRGRDLAKVAHVPPWKPVKVDHMRARCILDSQLMVVNYMRPKGLNPVRVIEEELEPDNPTSAPKEFQDLNPVRVIQEELEPDDHIIVIMGLTGAGKSTFIQAATGRDFGVDHGLESHTSQMTAIRVKRGNSYVVLVDTPGFDDTYLSDYDVLKLVSDWLRDSSASSAQSVKLCGILYLHRISGFRMGGTTIKNLEMFQKLCGKDRFEKVIFTTTMWPDDRSDYDDAVEREKELRDEYWKSMIQRGSHINRFNGTQSSAWSILDPLVRKAKQSILIQRELNKAWKDVPDTAAGKQLHGFIGKLVERQKVGLRQVLEEMGKTTDQEIKDTLIKEWLSLREEQEKVARDDQRLDSWVGRRFLKILIPKGKHAPAQFPFEDRCRDLISDILNNAEQYDRISQLSGGEAETMSIFLELIYRSTEPKDKRIKSLLLKLPKPVIPVKHDAYGKTHHRNSHLGIESRPQPNFPEVYGILLSIIRNDTIQDRTMRSLPATPIS